MVHGYYIDLDAYNILEDVPNMGQGHFSVWLAEETGWSMSLGWGNAFDRNTDLEKDLFKHFFSFVDQYRILIPIITASVTLHPKHRPTGKRRKYGMNGLMEQPDEILAINYSLK